MNITQKIDKFIKSLIFKHFTRKKDDIEFYNNLIIEYLADYKKNSSLVGVNLRDELVDSIIFNEHNLNRFDIFKQKAIIKNGIDSVLIKITEDFSKFRGSTWDGVLFDDCLQYFVNPVKIIRESLELSKYIVCIIKNYSHILRRFDFILNGRFDFLEEEKSWHNSLVIRPFGIYDFIDMCKKEHFLILEGKYMKQNGTIGDIFDWNTLPNSFVDEAFFLVKKF